MTIDSSLPRVYNVDGMTRKDCIVPDTLVRQVMIVQYKIYSHDM